MTKEEAINEIRSWDFLNGKEIEAVQTLIPELRESEDERMIRKIESFLSAYDAYYFKNDEWREIEVWLEKQKEQKQEQYSPLCNTVKDKIREYIANHFITDTVVKTDVNSIVKAMEEGVRLGKEEPNPTERGIEIGQL